MVKYMKDKLFTFDLDGTVTKKEILPMLAKYLDLQEELSLLTKLTLSGDIDFYNSFRLRFYVLNNIPISEIHKIIKKVPLDDKIVKFIQENKENCVIVTGNLNLWIEPLAELLGCRICSSIGNILDDGRIYLMEVMEKGSTIRQLRKEYKNIIAVGDSNNDVPMFEEADIAIAYGGVHKPSDKARLNSDYVVYDGGSLCKLLKML